MGSVYALSPKVYIFDEPSANLDYAATKRLAEIMGKLKRDGYTIFVVEHRFYYLRDLIDRVFLIQNGKIEQGIYKGAVLFLTGGNAHILWAADCISERDAEHYQEKERRPMGKHLLSVQGLSFAYPKEQEVFRNVSFEAHAGDVIGILGHNGAGKTTLLSILTGLLKQRNGEITFDGRKLTPRQRRARRRPTPRAARATTAATVPRPSATPTASATRANQSVKPQRPRPIPARQPPKGSIA